MAIFNAIIALVVIASVGSIVVSAARNYLACEEAVDTKIEYWEGIAAR